MKPKIISYPSAKLHPGVLLGKGVVKLLDTLVNMTVLSIFLLLFIYGSYVLWQSNQVYQAADSKKYTIYRPATQDEGSSFAALQQINPDTFAWLTIYGTNIDYPVAHTDNNERYVNTDIMGDYSVSGALFLDCNNAADFSDFKNIIYGHHMEKDAMFGELQNFISPEYFSSHLYGNLYFDGADHGLELFAFLDTDAYNYSIYTPAIPEGSESTYFSNLIESSLHSREITVNPKDHIVLLSTCTSSSTNGRHILVGKITDKVYADPYQPEAPAKTSKEKWN